MSEAMVSSTSPLSSRDLNRGIPTTVERRTSYKLSETHDEENLIQTDDRTPASSVADTTSSPIKIRSPREQSSPRNEDVKSRSISLTEDALRENEGLTRTLQILEDQCTGPFQDNVESETMSTNGLSPGYAGMDDTGFTTFSAVPNTDMTLFAQMRASPTINVLSSPTKTSKKSHSDEESSTPTHTGCVTPTSTRGHHFDDCSPSPTPRHLKSGHEDTTNLILDFTEQFSAFAPSLNLSSSHKNRPSPKKFYTQPDLASYASDRRTPSPNKRGYRPTTPKERQFKSLLDFDLTPAPTPQSVPSITARELESLKSSFLSQISSLRATLSGKEAEVNSLKDAVTDAERRVGEALEQIREERGTKENLQAEKLEWEKRDKEIQSALRDVKEEITRGEQERDQMQQSLHERLDESERKCEEAENKVIEMQSKIAGLGAQSGVEAAVDKVAKELFGLYKTKHEVKVAALKESYKARWERKISDLEARMDQVSRENEYLRLARDATVSGVVPDFLPTDALSETAVSQEQLDQERALQTQRIEDQANILAGVQKEMERINHDNAKLAAQLEKERLEMADLVAATEEMMQLSLQNPAANETAAESSVTCSIENLRGSISRSTSGLKAPSSCTGPGPGKSRIGRMGGAGEIKGRGGSGGAGLSSGIMGSIERMGRGRLD